MAGSSHKNGADSTTGDGVLPMRSCNKVDACVDVGAKQSSNIHAARREGIAKARRRSCSILKWMLWGSGWGGSSTLLLTTASFPSGPSRSSTSNCDILWDAVGRSAEPLQQAIVLRREGRNSGTQCRGNKSSVPRRSSCFTDRLREPRKERIPLSCPGSRSNLPTA